MSSLSVCRSQRFEPDMSPFLIERGCVLFVIKRSCPLFSVRGPPMSIGSTGDLLSLNCAFVACVLFPSFL